MKFSIRDMFLVTVIVALVLGWWADRRVQVSKADHWRMEAFKMMSWVDRNCKWVELGLTEDNVIVFLRETKQTDGLPNSQAPAPNPPKD